MLSFLPESLGKVFYYHTSLYGHILKNYWNPDIYKWWNNIMPNLWLGAIPLYDHDPREEIDIKTVISLIEEFEYDQSISSNPIPKLDWLERGINYHNMPTPDGHCPSISDLNNCVKIIHSELKKNNAIYVHCKAGKGRSACVIVAYLMTYHNYHLDDAINFVKHNRWQVDLNDIQTSILKQYQESYINQLSFL